MPRHKPLSDRFLQRISIDTKTGCWNWTGGRNATGYGCVYVGNRPRFAHRVSFELSYGEIPKGMCVCHRCDNRRCVNPSHLFLGTKGDNTRDMIAKGRQARGSTHGFSKLTDSGVAALREANDSDVPCLARELGITEKYAREIRAGRRRWTHLGREQNAAA